MRTKLQVLLGIAGACWLACACSRELAVERATPLAREPERAALTPAAATRGEPVRSLTRRAAGVAVVELFTSEGCSSCPPADRVLAKLAARARAQARSLPLYPLSFHVDYWDYLGWRDRFSSAAFSERQRGYAALGSSGGTYTPQVVVNGEAECVGSNASCVDALIEAALRHEPRTQIELEARRGPQGLEVSYRVSGDTRGRVLNLALIEPHAESQVAQGENAGERLAHVNVVRQLSRHPLSEGTAGGWLVPVVPGFDAQRVGVGVVAFVESAAQRGISGAAALELP